MTKLVPGLVVCLALFGSGCSATDPITNKFTCHDVCQRYADCFDNSYDVGQCSDKCQSSAGDSNDKQNKLNDCHDCIGDKSCVSDIASCSSSCGSFVP